MYEELQKFINRRDLEDRITILNTLDWIVYENRDPELIKIRDKLRISLKNSY